MFRQQQGISSANIVGGWWCRPRRICFNRQRINLSQVFAGQTVGIKQTDERIWLVSFMDYDLGYFDDETCRLEPLENPFGPKVLDPVVTSESSCRIMGAAA